MRDPRRTLAATVLVFEALVVLFAALVAKDLSPVPARTALLAGGGLALALVLCAGLLRSPTGYVAGSVLQAAVLATAWVVPAMALVGVIFAGLWVAALVLGRRIVRRVPPPG